MAGLESLRHRLAGSRAARSSIMLLALAGTLGVAPDANAGVSISINVGSSWSRGCGWYDTFPVWTGPVYHRGWNHGWAPAPCYSYVPPAVCFTPIYTPVIIATPVRPLWWHDDDLWCSSTWAPVYITRPRWGWRPVRRWHHAWDDAYCAPVPAAVAILQPAPVIITRTVAYSSAFSPWGTYTETTWYTPPAIYVPAATWCAPRPVCFVPPIYTPPSCSLYSGWSVSININDHRPYRHRLSHETAPVAAIPAAVAPLAPPVAAIPPTVPLAPIPTTPTVAESRPPTPSREIAAIDRSRLDGRRPTIGDRPTADDRPAGTIAAAPIGPAAPVSPDATPSRTWNTATPASTPSMTDGRRPSVDRWPTPDRTRGIAASVPDAASSEPSEQTPVKPSRTVARANEWPADTRRPAVTPARPAVAQSPSINDRTSPQDRAIPIDRTDRSDRTDRTGRTVTSRPTAVPTRAVTTPTRPLDQPPMADAPQAINPDAKPARISRPADPMSGPRLTRRDAPALPARETPARETPIATRSPANTPRGTAPEAPIDAPAKAPRFTPTPQVARPAPADVPIRGLESPGTSRTSRSRSIDVPANTRTRGTVPGPQAPSEPGSLRQPPTTLDTPRALEQPSRSSRPAPAPSIGTGPSFTRPAPSNVPSRVPSRTPAAAPEPVPALTPPTPAPSRVMPSEPTKRVQSSRGRSDRLADDRRVRGLIATERGIAPPGTPPVIPAARPATPSTRPSPPPPPTPLAPPAAPAPSRVAPSPAPEKSAPAAPAPAPAKGGGEE